LHRALTLLLTLLVSLLAGVSCMTDRVVANTYDHCNRLDAETITPSGGSAVTTDYDYDLADNRTFKTVQENARTQTHRNGLRGRLPLRTRSLHG